MLNYKFHKNEKGKHYAVVNPPYVSLGEVLYDIDHEHWFEEIEKGIRMVENDKTKKWEYGFDAHSLIIDSREATVEPYYEQSPPCTLPLENFKSILREWRMFVQQG